MLQYIIAVLQPAFAAQVYQTVDRNYHTRLAHLTGTP